MQKKDAAEKLKEDISLLESRRVVEKSLLKIELRQAFEQLKPGNVVKSTILDVLSSLRQQPGLFYSLLGSSTGLLSKAVFGGHPTLLNKLGAKALQQIIAMAVAKRSDAILEPALRIVSDLRRKAENNRRIAQVKREAKDIARSNIAADISTPNLVGGAGL